MSPISTALSTPLDRPSLQGKTVVVADDDETIRDYLEAQCRRLGLRVETAGDGLRAVLTVGKTRPDLLILDLNLPDVEGFRVVERLSDPKFAPVPIIILTGRSDEASIQRCADLDVYYAHKSADIWADIEPLIYKVLLEGPAMPKADAPEPAVAKRILVVDNDAATRGALAQRLQKYKLSVIEASGGTQGFLFALRAKPDLIVADYDMEEGSGHYLLSRVKSSPSTQHIPVIVYTAGTLTQGQEASMQRDLLGRGQAAAFITKRADGLDILAEIRKHVPFPN